LESEFWKRSHFGRFWSIKVKKTAKSQFSMLGTVGDGVKSNSLTASRVVLTASKRQELKSVVDDGVTHRASKVICVTA
jgi:hypothetical protein